MNQPFSSNASPLKRLAGFCVSVAILLFFIFYAAPYLDQAPFIKPMVDFIEENDIDAGALYYTEIEEFSDAEAFIKNSVKYSTSSDTNR